MKKIGSEKPSVRITGNGGQEFWLSKEEAEIIYTPLKFKIGNIGKVVFVILSLLKKRKMAFARALIKYALILFQRIYKKRPVSPEERSWFESSLFGFKPTGVEIFPYRLKFDLTYMPKEGNSLIFDIIIGNNYQISRERIYNKTVIDAGANIGCFSLFAASLGAKRVYAFEPVKGTYDILLKNIRLNKMSNRIIPINRALGEKEGESFISFRFAGDGGAQIGNNDNGRKSQKIRITTIDSFMKNKGSVDFIKMDVEGYEENVLLGARNTIKKYKPVLSFSAYHKKEDKVRLPAVVKSIRGDYSISLNYGPEDTFFCE